MKHKMNRILCALLTVLLCVGFLPVGAMPVAAESGTVGDNLTWTLENGVFTISGAGAMPEFSAREDVPWHAWKNEIQRIVVADGVTSVGRYAFYGCERLTTVTLASSVTILGKLSFGNCPELAQIYMPGVQRISSGCFYDCLKLNNVTLPQSLKTIEDQAFYHCDNLAGITIPPGVATLGHSAFMYCTSLTYVKIDAHISVLPYLIFYGCDKLSKLYLPRSVNSVEEKALAQCPELYSVDYGGSDAVREEIQNQLSKPVDTPSGTISKNIDYTQTGGATITTVDQVQTNIDPDNPEDVTGTYIDATVTDSSGWEDVSQSVEDTMNTGRNPTVNIQVPGNVPMPEGALNDLADKEVVVNIHTSENVDWQVIMRDQNADTLKGTQNFAVSLSKNEQGKYTDVIGSAESYTVNLGDTTLNSTILVPLGVGTARKVATLYVVDGNELRKLSSVIVDDDGKAAFHVAGTEAGDYVIALDVQNIPQEEVRIPQKLASEYDITYGATLMDAYGNQYVLTGRVNKMGFGIGTLTLIVVGVLVGSGIVVGVIMVIWNKQKRKMEKVSKPKKRSS